MTALFANKKHLWYSKTFWINLVGLIFFIIAHQLDVEVNEALIASVLALINILLRLITKKEINWD